MTPLLATWLLLSCVRIPDHLQLDTLASQSATPVEVLDLSSALASSLGADPLARHRKHLDPAVLESIPAAAPLLVVQTTLEQRAGEPLSPEILHLLEARVSQTSAVGWVRGERLAQIEAQIQNDQTNVGTRQVLLFMAPLERSSEADPLTRPPLEWLVGNTDPRAPVQAWGDRHVLLGWLTPGTPLAPVASALASSPFDAVRASSAGSLLMGAAAYTDGPRDPAVLEQLTLATELVALDAAANGPKARERWRARRDAVSAEVGSDKPELHLLRETLTAAAASGHPEDVGLGLIALQGLRWLDACDWQPCGGLDRTSEVGRSASFGPDADRLAAVWQAVMLEQARDSVEVAQDTARFSAALATLADALLGTAPSPLDETLLRRRSAGPAVWLSIARSLDSDALTTWEQLEPVLDAHLALVAERAIEKGQEKPIEDPLKRIRARALP